MGEAIGSGKFGMVRKATRLLDVTATPGDKSRKSMKPRRSFQNKVAIKKIKLDQLGSKLHIIAQEILTLKRVDHPSIVNLLEIYRDENTLYLVMEYIQGKELFEFIVEQESLKESDAASIIKQLIKCIYYLNTKKIAHRDLKLENIMIDPISKKIKLIDFGFS